jgi:hypothetical protein
MESAQEAMKRISEEIRKEKIAKMNRMAKIAMEGGSMEEIASLAPEEQFTANQMRNKMYFEKSLAEKYKAAEEASKERMARGVEKNLVSPTAEKYKAVLTEGEKKLASDISKNIAKAAPMETPYGKSLLSYTPEGKIAGKTGSVLRGLGRVAGPLGAALTALDLAQGLGEVQEKGAAKIAEDYKKSKMAESEAEILTPEADEFREGLKSKRTELEILRAELDRKRQREERENRGINRQALARDTLEKIGLGK